MARRTRQQLQQLRETLFPDHPENVIPPSSLRQYEKEMADSALILADDGLPATAPGAASYGTITGSPYDSPALAAALEGIQVFAAPITQRDANGQLSAETDLATAATWASAGSYRSLSVNEFRFFQTTPVVLKNTTLLGNGVLIYPQNAGSIFTVQNSYVEDAGISGGTLTIDNSVVTWTGGRQRLFEPVTLALINGAEIILRDMDATDTGLVVTKTGPNPAAIRLRGDTQWADVTLPAGVTLLDERRNGRYYVPAAVQTAVVLGTFSTSGATTAEMTSTIPAGSRQGMDFKKGAYIYVFRPGDAGTNTWVRTPLAAGSGPAPTAPTITGASPNSGAVGTGVTLTGTNFTGATTLTLNGVAVTGFVVVSATSITFTVPAGATTGFIAVTTPGGMGTSTGSFTVTSGTTTLTAPTGLAAVPASSTSIGISWNAAANNSGYTVQVATDSAFTAVVDTIQAATNATSATSTGRAPNTTYYVRVLTKGTGSYANSPYSAAASIPLGALTLVPSAANTQGNTRAGTGGLLSALSSVTAMTDATSISLLLNSTLLGVVSPAVPSSPLPASTASVSVYDNGVFVAAPVPSTPATDETVTIVLPGTGTRPIRVVLSTLSRTGDVGSIDSTLVKLITYHNATVVTPVTTRQPRRIFWLGDSKEAAIGPDVPGRDGVVELGRQAFPGVEVTLSESTGGKRAGQTFATNAAMDALIAEMEVYFDGGTGADCFCYGSLTYNDRAFGDSPATVATSWATFLDRAHAALPYVKFRLGTPIICGSELAAGTTAAMDDYRNALLDLQATRSSWLKVYDKFVAVSESNLRDGIHPTTAGNAQDWAFMRTTDLYTDTPDPMPFRIQQNDSRLFYSVTPTVYATPIAYQGACCFIQNAGDYFEMAIPAGYTTLRFEGYSDPGAATFEVFLDTVSQGVINQAAGMSSPGRKTYVTVTGAAGQVVRLTCVTTGKALVSDQVSIY